MSKSFGKRPRGLLATWAGLLLIGIPAAADEVRVALFDTAPGAPGLTGQLAKDALTRRAGWRKVPEGTKAHAFGGDAVLLNDRLGVVLRKGEPSAELWALGQDGWVSRARLGPVGGQAAPKLSAVNVVQVGADDVSVEAVFSGPGGGQIKLGVVYGLKVGRPIVQAEPRSDVTRLRVEAPCRFGVLPDFFADDIVLDAARIPAATAEVPSEHFLLHMIPGGEAIVMAIWDADDREIEVALSGQGDQRRIAASRIECRPGGKLWVAVLQGAGVWHESALAKDDAGKVVPLNWKMPYPAAWRADFARPDGLTNSWEMIAQQPDGRYHFMKRRPDFFENTERTFPSSRKGWSTALGSFMHPCWVDRSGEGFVQVGTHPHLQYTGRAIVYPLDRAENTGTEFAIVDLVRNSLGVGPCRYILDLEGQKVANKGLFTCGARAALDGIYQRKQQKQKKPEIEKVLVDVVIFVQAIRARIDGYVAFGHGMLEFLAEQKKAQPALAETIGELEQIVRGIDAKFEARRAAIRTPQHVAGLTDEFRKTLIDYEGPDALKKCQAITAAIVRVGDNQDHLVAECRMAIKILRQRAGLSMAANPAAEKIAREIRLRTHKALRGQLGHEGALYR